MAGKKVGSSSKKQHKAAVKKLEARLERADAKAARWKKRAKKHEAAAASAEARVSTLEAELAKPGPDTSAGGSTSAPDASWTVAELRAEARSRGLTGMSRTSKAEILAALT